MKKFYKFPSIDQFHNKVKLGNKNLHKKEVFLIKPKLHGTNAAIVLPKEGEVYCQSRKRIITPGDDNMGFAQFVDEKLKLNLNGSVNQDIVIYGEWCGKGIQQNDAITKIENKIFAIFAMYFTEEDYIMTDSSAIKSQIEHWRFYHGAFESDQIIVIDELATVEISFSDRIESINNVAEIINGKVALFEDVDPWISEKFGVNAPGEGVVVCPCNTGFDHYSTWTFKSKTQSHRGGKTSKSAKTKIPVSQDCLDFVDSFATDPRFEQAISELNIDFEMKNLGSFLKWINEDILKESKDELEAADFEWKQCSKIINDRARKWFMCNSI